MAKGKILVINTGSTSTKSAYFVDGEKVQETRLVHTAAELADYENLMDQERLRCDAVMSFLSSAGIPLEEIDIVMSRGGMFRPVTTGVYRVNDDMLEVLESCRDGVHASNLSAIIGNDIALMVNAERRKKNLPENGCAAYIADPAMSDEMLPECRVGGIPELPRRSFFHALNCRATLRRYLASRGLRAEDVTVIVAHIGGGITVSLHHRGHVIDTNNALGGDGPMTPERAGTCPAFQLIEMCYSGKYSEDEIKKKIFGQGGAVAWFGTNDLRVIIERAGAGDEKAAVFMKAFSLNIAKYIASLAATVCGRVDAILLTGGVAHNDRITDEIASRVSFIAPVEVYPGENEMSALAENGYSVLDGTAVIREYDKNAISVPE